MDDATLIDWLGGPAKLAADLGYVKGGTQRVFNWKARKRIPPEVKLERQDLFGSENVRRLAALAAAQSGAPTQQAA